MKKLLAILLAMAMTAGLIACGGSGSDTEPAGTEGAENTGAESTDAPVDEELSYTADGRIKLSWWTNYGTVIYETLMELCRRYNESQDK